jgi:hypothetical protein
MPRAAPETAILFRSAHARRLPERLFERRIQELETEIDFALCGRQWRGDAITPSDDPARTMLALRPKLQRVVGNRIRERAAELFLAPIDRFEFYPEQ